MPCLQASSGGQRSPRAQSGERCLGSHWPAVHGPVLCRITLSSWRSAASLPEIARSSCPLTSSRTPHCHRHHEHNPRQPPREEPHRVPKERTDHLTRVSEPVVSCRTSRPRSKKSATGFERHLRGLTSLLNFVDRTLHHRILVGGAR
jgi:hypothetical protein